MEKLFVSWFFGVKGREFQDQDLSGLFETEYLESDLIKRDCVNISST